MLGALCLGLAVISNASTDLSYKVRKGDTLGAIARSHGVNLSELAKKNGIKNPSQLSIGKVLSIPRPGAPVAYTVKKGETLGSIAARHHVSVSTLASYNKLSNPNAIRVGQKLLIPTETVTVRAHKTLSSSMKRSLDGVRVRRGRWKKIVIHHSATSQGTLKGMDEYHRRQRRMKNGLAYHFVIGNGRGMKDGEIAAGRRWTGQLNGGHLYDDTMNTYCLGICLVGNYDTSRPTRKQLDSLEALCRYLMQRCSISRPNICTHTQINTRPTRCPGRNFPTTSFLNRL